MDITYVVIRVSEYDKVKVKEFGCILVVIMIFMVSYFMGNGDWKLTLFMAGFYYVLIRYIRGKCYVGYSYILIA